MTVLLRNIYELERTITSVTTPYENTMGDELRRLKNEPFNGEIKTTIKKLINDLKIKENISEIRRINYVQRLRKIAS